MTSKISSTKSIPYRTFILENIRQRSWLFAVSFLAFFIFQSVHAFFQIENQLQAASADTGALILWLRDNVPYMLNGSGSRLLALVILLTAILCASTGFAYLHTPEKTDFFHGLPLTRTQWFLISYFGGLLLFLIPYLATSVCTIASIFFRGFADILLLADCLFAMLGAVLGFLFFYQVSLIAMMLTGKLVTGVLASLVLFVYADMLRALLFDLISKFLPTSVSLGSNTFLALLGYLSPLKLYELAAYNTVQKPVLVSFVPIAVLLLILFLAAAYLLYQKRPSEAAGNALAFPKTAPVVKILISVPTALFIGLYSDSFTVSADTMMIIVFSLCSVFLLCGLIEYIYHPDLKQIFHGKASTLISFLSVAGILCVFQFDLTGYNTYLPKEQKLESMSLSCNTFSDYFQYPDLSRYLGDTLDLLELPEMQITDFSPLYKLAEEGIENYRNDISYYSGTAEPEKYTPVILKFHQANGKSVYREYTVSKESLLPALVKLCETPAYREKLFPVFYLNYESISSIQMTDIRKTTSLNLSSEQRAALLNAYKKDVLSADIRTLQKTHPLGELSVQIPKTELPENQYIVDSYAVFLSHLYLYEGYVNTLSLLNEWGYKLTTELLPEDIVSMTLTTSRPEDFLDSAKDFSETNTAGTALESDPDAASDAALQTDNTYIITDPQEIAALLSRLHYYGDGILGGLNLSDSFVELILKGDTSTTTYPIK